MASFLQPAILTRRFFTKPDDDSEDESSSDSSPPTIARRSKFDDEEDDSDVYKFTVSLFRMTSSLKVSRSLIHGVLPRILRSSVKRLRKQQRPKPRQMQRQLQIRSQKPSE